MAYSATQIRTELLAQHSAIRSLMAQTRLAVERLRRGEAASGDLRECLARLASAVHRHNDREVEMLRDLLPTVDAWGPERAAMMVEEHEREHGELFECVVEAGATTDKALAAKLSAFLLDRLNEHMAREEKILLAEDVLRDDVFVREYFGG